MRQSITIMERHMNLVWVAQRIFIKPIQVLLEVIILPGIRLDVQRRIGKTLLRTKTRRFSNTIFLRVAEVLTITSMPQDRKSTRLNSSHVKISYAVFCLKKKK